MGVIKRGILGGFKGRVANVVGSSWKGIAYMKSLPLSVANPNTAGQQIQRGVFSEAVAFAKATLVSVIKPCWDRWAQQMSGYNAFVSVNTNKFGLPINLGYSSLVISQGIIGEEPIASLSGTDGDETVTITWSDGSGSDNKLATDEAYVVVCNGDYDVIKGFATGVARSAETVDVELDAAASTGDVLYAWLCFRRADGTQVSNSVAEYTSV